MTPNSAVFAGLFDPSTVWIFIPLSAIVLGISVGAIKIMLEHQQKMAQIMRGQMDDETREAIEALRMEVTRLGSMLEGAIRGNALAPDVNARYQEVLTPQVKMRE